LAEQDKFLRSDEHLAAPVVFKAIEPRVVPVAPAELHWQAAEYGLAERRAAGKDCMAASSGT
jgi:hypothetical protein